MIAVLGATGNTGRAAANEIKQLGQTPLCVVRNAEKARQVLGPDMQTAVADMGDRAALEKAFKGVTSVFLVTNPQPQMAELENNVIAAAAKTGVKYLVYVSGGRSVSRPDSETFAGRAHYQVEQKLLGSSLGWVILRPGLFMQNVLGQATSIKNDSKFVLPFTKDLPVALVDVRDTGAVAARILADPAAHAGKTYEFTGAGTTYGQFAEVFGQVLGRPITYVSVTFEQAEQAMKARNMPAWLVGHLIAIAKLGAAGAFSTENTASVVGIVKRAPLTTRQFVEDHKSLFM
jgi:uncharacterized protein YbjT (DUF2867 family)